MKKIGKIEKSVATLLAVVMMLSSFLPTTALAAIPSVSEPVGAYQSTDADNTSEGKIVKEIVENRDKNTKHFLKDDGTYEAVIYSNPVHYLDNGVWKDIDNSLSEVDNVDGSGNKVLSNKQNDFQVSIDKNADSKKLVSIAKGKYELEWNIENANSVGVRVESIDDTALNNQIEQDVAKKLENEQDLEKKAKSEPVLIENEKIKTLKNVSSAVTFDNVFTNVDFQYVINSNDVKENIIIKQPNTVNEFSFNLKAKNLIPKVQEDKSIIFYDNNDSGKSVFKMQAPFMTDANNEISNDIAVRLEESNDGYKLTLTPDAAWLNDSNRKYPVVLDPPISTSLDASDIHDTFVAQSLPNNNYDTAVQLGVGNGVYSGVTRSFIKFDLPTLTSGSLVTNAQLALSLYTSNINTRQVNVHKVNGGWDSSTLTWNNKPSYNTRIEDYQLVNGAAYSSWYFDVTSIVKDWYNTGNNYGLMLKHNDETVGYNEFLSANTSGDYLPYRPQVTLFYVNNSGLESYWTYHSQSVGRAGTGYINDYNGNLVFIHDDLSMSGNKLPVNIKHVYNSNDRTLSTNYGNGWRLNLSQRIIIDPIGGTNYYCYIDEDGTKHYFYYDSGTGLYKDETGLNITLTLNGDSTYTVKDKGGNQLVFTAGGYLWKIIDNNGNTSTLSYTGAILSKITDGAGRVTNFDSTPEGYLLGITDPAGRRTSFGYTGINLHTITYPDGKQTVYNYDANNNLTSVVNHDGYKMTYAYNSGVTHRVIHVLESYTDGTLGNELSIAYGNNLTSFTDTEGRKETYQFNDWGNTVNAKDSEGNASYAKYNEQTNSPNKNKTTLASKTQRTTPNYLKNHNLENTTDWTLGYWGTSSATASFTTEAKYFGSQSVKINKTNNVSRHFYSQTLTLQKGQTYTLSGYIKTSDISKTNGKGAAVFVNYQDATGTWQTVNSSYINGTNDWQREIVTFTLPADAASTTVYARAGIVEETGIVYIDSLQLEDFSVANRYNLLENGDFRGGSLTSWNKGSATDSNDTLVYIDSATDPNYATAEIDRYAFKINGVADKSKNVYQTINISGNAGDTFVVSGWAKAESVPLSSGRQFALDVGVQGEDGSYQYIVVPFNQDSSDWQYVSSVIKTDRAYKSINIYGLYYNNANTAYFDGFRLYKEEFGDSYIYDANGNLTSVTDIADQTSGFTYNTTNDLVTATDPVNSQFKYEYDTKHNVTKATSAENVVYSFTYDSYGNPLTSKVGDSTLFINSMANYTADGNYAKSLTDSSGNTTVSNWDETKGILNSQVDAEGNFINYAYDSLDRLTSVSTALGSKNVESFAYNGSTAGSKGTKAVTDNAVYEKDVYEPAYSAYMANYQGTTNLLTSNTSFESGTTGWTITDWNGLTGAWRVVTDGINGSKALESYDSDGLTNGSTTNAVAYQTVTFAAPLTSAGSYTLSTYAKRTGSTQPVLGIYSFDSSGNAIPGGYQNFTQTIPLNQWVRISQTFTVPVGTKQVKVLLRSSVKDADAVRFDGAQFEAKSFSTPYTATTSSNTKVTYNLGVNKNSGTMSVWMNTKGTGSRQVLANEVTGQGLFNVYIDSQDKLKLAVRNTAGTFTDVLTVSDPVINRNQWYFVALKWELSGNALNATLYLNDQAYSVPPITDFKDFSGGITGVGNSINGTTSFNGNLKSFSYTPKALSTTDINALYNNTFADNPVTNITNSYTYENDRLKTITHNGFSYIFNYDSLGNNTTVKVGTQTLITNEYEPRTSQLLQSTYGNGQQVSNDYDSLDRVIASKYNGNIRYTYEYDASGNLGYQQDLVNGVNYRYVYDIADRLVLLKDSSGNVLSFSYDEKNNNSKISDKINGTTYETNYGYDKDNKPTSITYTRESVNSIDFAYDALGRQSSKTINTGSGTYSTNYSYLAGSNGSATTKVGSVTNNGSAISYSYDANGNIETITQNGQVIKYYYNELNELVREDNQVLNKTITYSYDVGGNLLSKIEYPYTTGTLGTPTATHSYAYGDANWKDKLTSYDGKAITYDAIGNPLTYNGWNYGWEEGRQLQSLSGNGNTISYKYNANGTRTSKTVNGVTTNYHLVGDKVTYESNGTDAIYYTYDSAGNMVSMNLNGVEYYYIRNAQGDIIGLFDSAGTQVVSYTYDSWGKVISTTGSLATTVGAKNPYKYREYRYDTETGLYYLQSRYYNPDWGRFVNADSQLNPGSGLTGMNLFAYGGNNPINTIDPSGHAFMLVTAAIGGVVGAVAGGVIAYVNGEDWRKGALIGAAAGGLIGLGAGAAAGALLAGSATASTGAVMAGLGTIGTAAAGGGAAAATVANKLPNYQKAVIDTQKLTGYALNPEHPVGGNKARVFQSALGYTQSNAEQLRTAVMQQLPKYNAVIGKLDQYGQRYTVDMMIKGPNGTSAMVRTGWMIKTGENIPSLVTIFVK